MQEVLRLNRWEFPESQSEGVPKEQKPIVPVVEPNSVNVAIADWIKRTERKEPDIPV